MAREPRGAGWRNANERVPGVTHRTRVEKKMSPRSGCGVVAGCLDLESRRAFFFWRVDVCRMDGWVGGLCRRREGPMSAFGSS